MNWTDVAKALPAGAGLLANILMPGSGAAVSTVSTMIAHALGVDTTPEAVSAALLDPAAQERLLELQETNRTELAKLAIARDIAVLQEQTKQDAAAYADVQDARKAGSGNWMVMWIGVLILVSFAVAMICVLYGCWQMVAGHVVISAEQAGAFAAITGLVGAIVGYFASNAQTVVNYLFGGSLGGRKNADALSQSVQTMGSALGKAAAAP